MSDTKIRVGLIGAGFIGKLMHAPYVTALSDLYELTVVGTSRREEILSLYPSVEVVTDYVAVCQHEKVDLVVIASPNLTHYELCKVAMHAGRHVLCDKPLVETEAQARQLKELAEAKGVVFSVFQNRRYDADFRAVQDAIKANVVGEVRLVETRLDRFRLNIRDRWREHEIPCSGVWWDIAPHLIDQIMLMFGVPKSVNLSLGKQRGADQADDFAHAVLDYEGGLKVVANMCVSARPQLAPRFTVHGTTGSIQKLKFDEQEDQLLHGMSTSDAAFGLCSDKLMVLNSEGERQADRECPRGEHLQFYRDLAAAIRGKGPNPVLPMQAVVLMHILEGAEAAARKGQRFDLRLSDMERAAY